MKYYEKLDTFEDWDLHNDFIMSNLGYDNQIQLAIDIIEDEHNIERYLYKGTYNRHPLRVARILIEEFGVKDKQTILIALLHDIIEWSDYDEKNILKQFGGKTFTGIEALTKKKGQDVKGYLHGLDRIGSINLVKVKLADRIDNNRGVFFSTKQKDKDTAYDNTTNFIIPLAKKYYPYVIPVINESIDRLEVTKQSCTT